MHRLFRGFILLGAVSLVGLTVPVQAEELTRGEMLTVSCAGCHGTDGKSPGAIPSIAGKTADFIETALKEFGSGMRDSTVMGQHAKGYTDEEIKLIAQYLASR